MRRMILFLPAFSLLLVACFSTYGLVVNRQTYVLPQEGMQDLEDRHIIMPSLPEMSAKYWFNADDTLNLKGKVVLIDFWDYTCVNCIRTLPYLEEWYRRYKDNGLIILGVHSPEFEFAKSRKNVAEAIQRFDIKYPVVMDNNFEIWDRFGNQYWPAKYLFDKNGVLRYVHFGEGEYGNFEAAIQKLLKEVHPHLNLPPIMKPIRATDTPGAVCYRTTPETYLGYERGSLGNKEGYARNKTVLYSEPRTIEKDRFYLVGEWEVKPQFIRYAGTAGQGKLIINYIAAEANLVIEEYHGIALSDSGAFRVYVYQDGKPLPKEDWSRDIQVDASGRTYINVHEARMYYLVKNKEYGRHVLVLQPTSDKFAAYAFTFVTACQSPAN
jgi:thiol-disulfide isomerase/thioredoxin